jgi:NitT/TauT family transport system substrate-binding protein
MMHTYRWISAVGGLLLSSLSTGAAELTKITVVSQHPVVGPSEEVMGFAIPMQMGYLRDEGLDATLQMASGAGQSAQLVQSGRAEFASSQPEAVLKVREEGGDVVAFFTLKRDNGSKVYVVPNSPIQKLEDLKGKRIGALSFGAGAGLVTRHTLSSLGIAPDQYQPIAVGMGPAAIAALQNNNIDALVMWEQMYASAENVGVKLRAIDLPAQREIAGFSYITTDRLIRDKPQVVEGFCRATAKGHLFASANPEAAIKLFYKQFPTVMPANLSPDVALKNDVHSLSAYLEMALKDLPLGGKVGEQVPSKWQFTARIFKEEGVLKGTVPTESGYSNRFFESCNSFDREAVIAAARNYK